MKRYIGDSVYAEIKTDSIEFIVLTTENDSGPPSNRIVLGIDEFNSLLRFVANHE